MSAVSKVRDIEISSEESGDLTLDSRKTSELIFAFVGPIGSGVSFSANVILEKMKKDYGYEGRIVKISKFISSDAIKVGVIQRVDDALHRIEDLQKAGNELRRKYGADYLARRVVEDINENRASGAKDNEESIRLRAHADPRRYVTIIDSLKRPEEIALLRRVYGDLLHVFCVFAPEGIRRKRLGGGNFKVSDIDKVFEIDENEGTDFGQKVRDSSHVSDFFILNDKENDISIKVTLDRFLDIIFGTKIHTPTSDEAAMYAAIAAARGSACLSRQVGAVIYNEFGEQIGRGCNDVPKSGGGLYGEGDGDSDHRCFKWGGKICHNDHQKDTRYDDIVKALIASDVIAPENFGKAKTAVSSTKLKDLIEFSRAVHAEMEAIISVARNGNSGLVGSTLYCTTFPCHNCARHIVASGIKRVVYIEPYAKSLAGVLHDDAVKFSTEEGDGVAFQQYQGVAPRNVDRLFGVRGDRKRFGKLLEIPSDQAEPAGAGPLDGIAIRENLVISESSAEELAVGETVNEQAPGADVPA